MTEEKTKEIVPLIFDKAFKAVFIKEDDILIKMIKDIFPIPKSNNPFTMVGFETVPPSNDGKAYRGDILIKLSDNSYVSIEMNIVFEDDIFNRNIIHLVRIHNQILKEGEINKNISRYRMMQLNLNLNDKYDMIFIDAAKGQYLNFFNKYKDNLVDDGFIVSDNIEFHGHVENYDKIENRNLRQLVGKLIKYIDFLKTNDEYNTKFYKVGDGLAITYKKGEVDE